MSQNYKEKVCNISPVLRMLINPEKPGIVIFHDEESPNLKYKTALVISDASTVETCYQQYIKDNGSRPTIVIVKKIGVFALGANYEEATRALKAYTEDTPLSYAKEEGYPKRMNGRIAIVTGGAQGFGEGIANGLAREGAHVTIADLNLEGAQECANALNDKYGEGSAIAVKVDVSSEASVEAMVQDTVLAFGGLDIMVANAGVAIAGDLEEMTREKFDFVTGINYTGYFLSAKYASRPMKLQTAINPKYWTDIIEINSKSGLVGSRNNFAYAGSKFGGVGLTQSFALELVEYSIKVNAICPGNLLDGPLWSDPEKGLFKQYLEAGKVEGATCVEDVRKHYEGLVPMNRGCQLEDIVTAVMYVVDQKYETGQALPVAGGQVMLN